MANIPDPFRIIWNRETHLADTYYFDAPRRWVVPGMVWRRWTRMVFLLTEAPIPNSWCLCCSNARRAIRIVTMDATDFDQHVGAQSRAILAEPDDDVSDDGDY
jgi:hypothetical protein